MAAVLALVQLDAAKSGKQSVVAIAAGSGALYLQAALTAGVDGLLGAGRAVAAVPRLYADNEALRARASALRAENARLREAVAQAPGAAAAADLAARESHGVAATAVGYDPESVSRTVTIDKGSNAGIARDDGVVDGDGVVGRIVDVAPLESTVLLLTDAGSKVPSVVQRGRWWGIATGTNAHVRLLYVSQDAKLKTGDRVVTGEGRSFHAGVPIGRIVRVDHPEGALYQSALLEPAAAFGRLSHVVVVRR